MKRIQEYRNVYRFAIVYGAVLAVVLTASCFGWSQSFTGKWAGSQRTLANGEQERTLIQLTQSGDHVSGTLKTFGYQNPISGTVTGNHIQLMAPWNPKEVLAAGELAGSDLHLVWDHRQLVMKPATAADDIPMPAYITPPPLKKVAYNGLAKTPPMGWNSWNLFAEKIDDATVRKIADAMVSSGMRDAGYIYVNIDDTWEGTRDAQGILRPNHKFPDMKALAAYVHSKGLKLGIYSSPGPRTCGGYPGSYGHEKQDADTFAAWGIDYLKYDWCSAGGIYKNDQLQPVYQKMGAALEATGRPIVFSLCEYGMGHVETWGPSVGGNLWRTTGDIRDEWSSMIDNAHRQIATAAYAGPGHWNDPDMLEIGNGHMTNVEYRTHMSLWSLLAAPLLAGNDIRDMSQATKDILMNREVIAIDQDPLGKQATRIAQSGQTETWLKPLADGGVAVGVINLGAGPTTVTVNGAKLGLPSAPARARNLWTHHEVTFAHGAYSETVPSHGTLLLRIGPHA
jgi:alpha-galactosidase